MAKLCQEFAMTAVQASVDWRQKPRADLLVAQRADRQQGPGLRIARRIELTDGRTATVVIAHGTPGCNGDLPIQEPARSWVQNDLAWLRECCSRGQTGHGCAGQH